MSVFWLLVHPVLGVEEVFREGHGAAGFVPTAGVFAGGEQGGGSLLSRWVGGILDRTGAKLTTVIGVILCAAATVPFAIATTHTGYLLLGPALIVRGGALSAVNIAITTGAFTGRTRPQIPAGSAIVRLLQQLGGSVGTVLLAVIVAGSTITTQPLTGFHTAFDWSIGLTLIALIPCLLIPPHGHKALQATA